ncbi:MAG: hypothetical protein MI975_22265 [Cytophagales bacterium]|nr:hypothetical protein [Cytophagales bacterium]
MAISFVKSLDNKSTMDIIFAPNTFLVPISLDRCVTINVDNPNRPRSTTIMTNTENTVKTFETVDQRNIACQKTHQKKKSNGSPTNIRL